MAHNWGIPWVGCPSISEHIHSSRADYDVSETPISHFSSTAEHHTWNKGICYYWAIAWTVVLGGLHFHEFHSLTPHVPEEAMTMPYHLFISTQLGVVPESHVWPYRWKPLEMLTWWWEGFLFQPAAMLSVWQTLPWVCALLPEKWQTPSLQTQSRSVQCTTPISI